MIYVFLAEGFEEIEALTPVDLLKRGGHSVATVGIGGKVITGSHGIKVEADISEDDFSDNKPEAIILPGGMPGAKNLDASQTIEKALQIAIESGALICAICAAPFILGKRGLLKGRKATCYPGFEKNLEGALVVPDVRKEKVVTDGRFITACGMGAAKDFALAIINELDGPELAFKINYSIIGE